MAGALATRDVPETALQRGVTDAQWNTLTKSLYPGANPASVLMVIDYCAARKLDPMKKPCHIVPMEVKDARTSKYEWRDVVMPGIYELRTTAQRTGEYLGHAKPEYGPSSKVAGVDAPEWCEFTVYRWNPLAGLKAEFPVRVLFAEVVATKRDGGANARWSKAPTQMLTKCAEAAALREAFPDELGGQQTAEEMDGRRAEDVVEAKAIPPVPDALYDEWLAYMAETADKGTDDLQAAWKAADVNYRRYLTTHFPEKWEALKAKAEAVNAPVDGVVEPPL